MGEIISVTRSNQRGCRKEEITTALSVGPFPITQIMGPATYKIELPPRIKGHNHVLNVSKLKAHHENNIEGRYVKEPGAIGVDRSGNNLYRMDKILDMKYLRKNKYYLIQWVGV